MDSIDYLQRPRSPSARADAAGLVAIACGAIEPFVVMRRMAFAVHG
jgi:hypothetical protein